MIYWLLSNTFSLRIEISSILPLSSTRAASPLTLVRWLQDGPLKIPPFEMLGAAGYTTIDNSKAIV